jgi:N-acetyl-anhydromuramyl-L-alanine amidase AmpD
MPVAKTTKRKIDTTTRRAKGNWNNKPYESRKGIMMHYDASASDAGAVEFLLRSPACKASYNKLILDDGTVVDIAPDTARAWHAGNCRPSSGVLPYKDANSAFYGVAFAATYGSAITEVQFAAAVRVLVAYMRNHKWTDVERHITDHAAEAWPRGRKVDIGGLKGASLESLRAAVHTLLTTG